MKVLTLFFVLFSQNSFANFNQLGCNANFQPQVGQSTKRIEMTEVNPGGFGDVKFETILEDYTYEVVWHKELDTFYFTIKKGNHQLLFSTGRVPTFEHNDTIADVVIPDGTRRWVSCSYKSKK